MTLRKEEKQMIYRFSIYHTYSLEKKTLIFKNYTNNTDISKKGIFRIDKNISTAFLF